MRATLTLDDDVAARLQSESRRFGRPFQGDYLRRGLEARRTNDATRPFKVKARALGVRPGLEYDNVSDLIEQFEGPIAR